MYTNPYTLTSTPSFGLGALIWLIITLVVALAGCFVVYFLFVKREVKTNSKFLRWLREFLAFDKMFIEDIVKIAYIFTVIFLTLGSFALIGTSFLGFILTLICGNILARIGYELSVILIMIWKNTRDINKKLK